MDIEVKGAQVVGTTAEAAPVTDITKMKPHEIKAYLENIEVEDKKAAKKQKEAFETEKSLFVVETANEFKAANELLANLKKKTLAKAQELYERMFVMNGKEVKEQNSFTFKSEDGKMKVQVERQERFEFNEHAIVHINTIKDIFRKKFEDRNKGLYNLLDGILMRNTKGDYDAKLLTKARNQVNKLGDEGLIAEFDKLVDCQRVTGSAMYCRAYIVDEHGKWQDINVQFSSL